MGQSPGRGGAVIFTDPSLRNTWARDISTVEKQKISGQDLAITRPAQGLNFAVSAGDIRQFLNDIKDKRITHLTLQIPHSPPGCKGQVIFNGRTKSNDARIKTFSLECNRKVDAWEIFPDNKSKPVAFFLDPDHIGRSSIVVFSNPVTGRWQTSLWDFFRDQTFAVTGLHEDGKIQPTKFTYTRN
jgi:hypothetical protein